MAVPLGVSRPKRSGGCLPEWISEEHIEVKHTDSAACLLKRCVTNEEKDKASFRLVNNVSILILDQDCSELTLMMHLCRNDHYFLFFNSLCLKEWG